MEKFTLALACQDQVIEPNLIVPVEILINPTTEV
jgi:hypothetical protein